MPLPVSDTSIELYGPSAFSPFNWDTAKWDGPSKWYGDQWNSVDCQITEAAITWGADAASGVLTQSAAGQILCTTYDPNRLLDPGNAASVFKSLLKEGTKIRLTYLGSPLREGRLSSVVHSRADNTGRIEGLDAIGQLAAAETPITFRQTANGLYAFAAQVIASASLDIPVQSAPGGVDVVIAWRERSDGQNVWSMIRDAALDALHLAYIDPTGVLCFAPFGAPVDRGLLIGDGGICLEDLETSTDDTGTYTDFVDSAGAMIPASGLPQPRTLSVNRRIPSGAGWANAVKKDRAPGNVLYVPSLLRPDSAAQLSALVAMRGCDKVRLKLDTAPTIDVSGRAVGQTLRAPAGGNWSAGVGLYVPPVDWAYVPPTPAAVTGTTKNVTVPCIADTDVGLYWNTTVTPAKAMSTGAGQSTQFPVQGGNPSSGAPSEAKSRALLLFDFTVEGLWDGIRIYRSAKLRIYVAGTNATATILVQRVLEPWNEGYGNAPLDFNQSGVIYPGPQITTTDSALVAQPSGVGYWEADITNMVRRWIPRSLGGDALPNLGLQLRSNNEVQNQGTTFRSREHPSLTPPQIVITGEG
jgi:hypothetical protein